MMTFDYNEQQPIIEIYECIQGEGKYIGTPSILIRVVGCKLRCFFKGNFCDTFYSSWKIDPKAKKYTLNEIQDFLQKSKLKHVIITGGSPTLYPDLLKQIIYFCTLNNKFVTLETEGSQFVDTNCDFLSLSPKLENSIPPNTPAFFQARKIHLENYNKYDEMQKLIENAKDFQVKFVISDEENIEEVKNIINILKIPNEKVYLMPEGIKEAQLADKSKWIISICIKNNYNFSDRLHIRVFGNIKLV